RAVRVERVNRIGISEDAAGHEPAAVRQRGEPLRVHDRGAEPHAPRRPAVLQYLDRRARLVVHRDPSIPERHEPAGHPVLARPLAPPPDGTDVTAIPGELAHYADPPVRDPDPSGPILHHPADRTELVARPAPGRPALRHFDDWRLRRGRPCPDRGKARDPYHERKLADDPHRAPPNRPRAALRGVAPATRRTNSARHTPQDPGAAAGHPAVPPPGRQGGHHRSATRRTGCL